MAPIAAASTALDMPVEIWDEIISKLEDDRRCKFHLQSLSRVCKQLLSITNHHKQTLKIIKQNVDFLPSLFHRFPNLKHISLSGCPCDHLFPILHQIARFNMSLESLDLSNHPYLPVIGLKQLPVTLTGVKSLNLSSIPSINDYDLRMIADYFPSLEDLNLSNCNNRYNCHWPPFDEDRGYYKKATDDGISVLASRLNGLRRINLNGNHWVSDKALISLSKNCPDLEEISVKQCKLVTQIGIGFALQGCKNLRKLIGLSRMRIDDIIQPLSQARSLSAIDFFDAFVSNESLFAMANANLPLKSFSLDGCHGFSYAGISAFLTSYDSLDHFAIKSHYNIYDESMITLVKCLTKARSVILNHCLYLSESTLFNLIKQCPLLEKVEMRNTSIGKEGFREYDVVSRRMKTLDLSWNMNLDDESLKRIALACPNLETLLLDYCNGISISCVGEIYRKCPRLNYTSATWIRI